MTDGTWKEIERVEKSQDENEENKIENLNEDTNNELNGSTGIRDITTEGETSKVC